MIMEFGFGIIQMQSVVTLPCLLANYVVNTFFNSLSFHLIAYFWCAFICTAQLCLLIRSSYFLFSCRANPDSPNYHQAACVAPTLYAVLEYEPIVDGLSVSHHHVSCKTG